MYSSRRVPQYSMSGTTRVWRLAWSEYDPYAAQWGIVHPLRTGLAANEVECSPCVSIHAGQVHVSFIGTAGHGTGRLEHHLLRMSGPGLDQLAPAIYVSAEECFSGFWRPDQTALSSGRDGTIRLRGTIDASLESDFEEIARISFTDDDHQRLLITGVLPGEIESFAGQPQPHTVVYDVVRDVVVGELLVGGVPAYKPSLSGGKVAHVEPHPSPRRESWKVSFDNRPTIVPTGIVVKRTN